VRRAEHVGSMTHDRLRPLRCAVLAELAPMYSQHSYSRADPEPDPRRI